MTNQSADTRKQATAPAKPKSPTQAPAKPKVANAPQEPASQTPKRPSKIDAVIALLKRPRGATLQELIKATAWLPHTTRAALTGLKKKGHTVERAKSDGVSLYSITKMTSK